MPIGSEGIGTAGRTYEILATIERGGMGELFLARVHGPGLKPQFAVLKRLLADLLDDDKYIQMFRSEAQVMAELDHPNLVRVIDMPRFGGRQCLAMEYVRGRNVHQMLTRCLDLGTHMPPEIVLAIMTQVLQGLEYAHNYRMKDGTALELVHRDVTPGNVLVGFDGAVKLTDFGIAKSKMSLVETTVGIVKGKARYLSPEQILGDAATPASDLFSSAAVICEMLTGVPAFDRGTVPKTLFAIVNGEPPDLERTLPFRAPLLVSTLMRALALKQEDRIKTAQEFAGELEVAARLFGPLATRNEIGRYASDLFRNVEDPLSEFFEEAEAETVHGFRPNGTGIRELIHDDEEPTGADTMDVAAEIARSSTAQSPTQIVRGTPVEPPQPQQPPPTIPPLIAPIRSVDEAMSVLASLQSRPIAAPAGMKQLAVEAATVEGVPFVRPRSRRTALMFGAGLISGVVLTLGAQAIIFNDPDPEPPDEEDVIVEAMEAEVPTPPDPDPVAPATELPAPPPPPPRPSTLDILYPRGARVRIDGKLLASRVPIRGVRLTPGPHSAKIWKGRYQREIRFEAKAGGRYVMNRKLVKK